MTGSTVILYIYTYIVFCVPVMVSRVWPQEETQEELRKMKFMITGPRNLEVCHAIQGYMGKQQYKSRRQKGQE